MTKTARFGSVEWQEEMRKRILNKLSQGKEIDAFDKQFIKIQLERAKRLKKLR